MKPKLVFASMMAAASSMLGLSGATEKASKAFKPLGAPSKFRSKVVYTPEYRPKAASRRAFRQLKHYRRRVEFNNEYEARRAIERSEEAKRKRLYAY